MDITDAIEARFAELRQSLRKVGTVTVVSGNQVKVAVEDASLWLPYYEHYIPAVGHVVTIDCTLPGSWIVLGRAKP